jgi:hypothetical protein
MYKKIYIYLFGLLPPLHHGSRTGIPAFVSILVIVNLAFLSDLYEVRSPVGEIFSLKEISEHFEQFIFTILTTIRPTSLLLLRVLHAKGNAKSTTKFVKGRNITAKLDFVKQP